MKTFYYSNEDIDRLILSNPHVLRAFMTFFEGGTIWKKGEEDISTSITSEQVLMALCMTLAAVDKRLPVEDDEVTEDISFEFEDEDWTLRAVWTAAGGYVGE